jgi:hypothetical protein
VSVIKINQVLACTVGTNKQSHTDAQKARASALKRYVSVQRENNLRLMFILLLTLTFSGCALNMPSNEKIKQLSNSKVECDQKEINIVHRRNSLTSRDWDLSCGDKEYFCEMDIDNSVSCKSKK